MKNTLLVFASLLFCALKLSAQKDSLTLKQNNAIPIEETSKPTNKKESNDDQFYRQAYDFYKISNYSKALFFINKAIAINPKIITYYELKTYIYSKQQDYENAIKTAEAALKIDPNDVRFYELKGNGLSLLNRKGQALDSYERMIILDKFNARYYNNYLTTLVELKMFEKTIEVYQTYLDALNDENEEIKFNNRFEADIHFYASIAYDYCGDKDKTLQLLNKCIELAPNFAGYYSNRGNLFSDQKNYTDALADYNKAISLNPQNENFYFNRGSVYLDLEKYKEALSDYKLAQKYGCKTEGFYQNLGNVYKSLKKNDEALNSYKKVLEINPDNKEVYNNLAILYKAMGNKTESDKAYKEAVSAGSKTSVPLYNQGFDAMNKNDFETAITFFKKAILEKPDFSEAYNQLGICYNKVDKDSLALVMYTIGINKNKTDFALYHNRANLYKKIENFEAAKEDYLTVLKLDPTKNIEYYSLAQLYLKQNNTKLASQYYDLATESGLSTIEYYIDYSFFLTKNHDYKKCAKILEKGIIQYPKNYDLLINLASNYTDQENYEKTVQTLKTAIALNPDKADAYYNLGNYYLVTKKDLKNAEKNYQLAIIKNNKIMEAYLNLAVVYENMQNETKMMQTIDDIIENFPNAYESYYNRAEFFYKKGMLQEAIADFEKSFELMDTTISDKKNETYNTNIEKSSKSLLKAQAYQLMEQYDKAINAFELYIAFNGQDANARSNYAYCLLEFGRPDEAQENFEKAYKLDPKEIDILLGLIASNYLLHNQTDMKKYKIILEKSFPRYKVNKQLPEILSNEGYLYTPKFIKIWNDAFQK